MRFAGRLLIQRILKFNLDLVAKLATNLFQSESCGLSIR
jgi:hypothetical protein